MLHQQWLAPSVMAGDISELTESRHPARFSDAAIVGYVVKTPQPDRDESSLYEFDAIATNVTKPKRIVSAAPRQAGL